MQDIQTADRLQFLSALQRHNSPVSRLLNWLFSRIPNWDEAFRKVRFEDDPKPADVPEPALHPTPAFGHDLSTVSQREFMLWTAAAMSAAASGNWAQCEKNLHRAACVSRVMQLRGEDGK